MAEQRYLVSARKYRPQLFRDLIAQEHVSETLKNAIRLHRLAQAYLFSGPRGVGKTTAARILAKAINCTTPPDERADAAEPCRTCDSCRSFEEGRNLNIIEIDAASNNGVDNIRDLRETVRVPPQGSLRKVYILDEAHMLSKAAWNALLKTLEEPPPYVLFIFATTEPHKMLPTILSRCQRFDFRRMVVPEVVTHLRQIAENEGITADEESLVAIARRGDGAMRDALSAFDQAVSLCGTNLEYHELAGAFRVVDVDLFFKVTEAVHARSAGEMLLIVDEIVRQGYDFQEFLVGLAEHLRNLLVARTTGKGDLIEAVSATQERYVQTAGNFTEPDLLRLLTLVLEAQDAIRESAHPRFKLEATLLRMAVIAQSVDLRDAIKKIEHLEQALQQGKAENPISGANRPNPVPVRTEPRPAPVHQLNPTSPRPAAPESQPSRAPSPAPATGPSRVQEPDAGRPAGPVPVRTSGPSRYDVPAIKSPRTPDRPSEPHNALFAGSGALATVLQTEASPLLQQILDRWPSFVEAVLNARVQTGAVLQHGQVTAFDTDTVWFDVPSELYYRLLERDHDFLCEQIAPILPEVRRFRFNVRAEMQAQNPSAEDDQVDPSEYMRRKTIENPVVKALMDQFGGELVW